ncbi:MAG TPA: hypothetical protein VGD67_01780 [Pseudonocardiaceae bacterium]
MSSAVPREVATSYLLWSAAIAAGIFDTVLSVVHAVSGDGSVHAGQLVLGVTLRIVAFLALAYLVAQLWLGRRWSRYALALVPGAFGVLALTVGPATWLAGGGSVTAALTDADVLALVIGASRIMHVCAVLGAVVFMFLPAANTWFRAPAARPAPVLAR